MQNDRTDSPQIINKRKTCGNVIYCKKQQLTAHTGRGGDVKYGNQNARRVERAIDELIKVQDTGKGTGELQRIIDALNSLKYHYLSED